MDTVYRCAHCRGSFAKKDVFNAHLLSHTGANKYTCSKCSKNFKQKSGLGLHMRRVHQKIKKYKCHICTFMTSTLGDLKLHLGTHDKAKSYPCPLCPAVFVQKGALSRHLNSEQHAGLKKYKCTVCNNHFNSTHALKFHLESIHSVQKKIYKCKICSLSFNHIQTLETHLNSHSKLKRFKCNLCPKRFLKKQDLRYHTLVHSASKPFKCHICASKFRTKGKLTEHIKHVHEKTIRYRCPTCQKTFSQKGNLLIHTRRHVGQQKCKCTHCPFLADCKRDLNRHLKVHLADGKYKCTECTASFNDIIHQRRHLRLVHKKEPGVLEPKVYKCSKCPREYKFRTSWQRHELTHGQIKNFKCEKCVAKFYTETHLRHHMTGHENVNGEFVCKICNAEFNTRHLLSYHNKLWHGLDTTLKTQGSKCQLCVAHFKQKIHMIRHKKVHETASTKYYCQPCNATFSSSNSLSSHNRKWHSKETSFEDVLPLLNGPKISKGTLSDGKVNIMSKGDDLGHGPKSEVKKETPSLENKMWQGRKKGKINPTINSNHTESSKSTIDILADGKEESTDKDGQTDYDHKSLEQTEPPSAQKQHIVSVMFLANTFIE